MKPLSILFLIFFLINNPIHSQIPTNADPPEPEHVLVVYNSPIGYFNANNELL